MAAARDCPEWDTNFQGGTSPHDDHALSFTGALRASWEVCPKHQNIRREYQRVRLRSDGADLLGKGFALLFPFGGCAGAAFGVGTPATSMLQPTSKVLRPLFIFP